jgi:large subunit ribosomal protein L6
MSRIGKAVITVPKGIDFKVSDKNLVTIKGPKGELTQQVDSCISFKLEEDQLSLVRATDQKRHKALHGLYRSLIANMIEGVEKGFKTVQELIGVGYRASNKGQLLELTLGFSHNISFMLPVEIKATTTSDKGKAPTIILESCDKQLLGQVAAKIRSLRKPEPYKGKGIKFAGEVLRRKAGKAASK